MSDKKLREFFEVNKKEFEIETPPIDLWDAIEKELPDKPKHKKTIVLWTRFGKIAAVLLLTFGMGYWAAQQNKGGEMAQHTPPKNLKVELAKIAPDMVEVENFYATNIANFKQEIKAYDKIDETLVNEFLKEHEALDLIYKELKQMLLRDVDNEQIVSLMIQNLQMRVNVLEKQKSILQNIKKYKKGEKNEKSTIL